MVSEDVIRDAAGHLFIAIAILAVANTFGAAAAGVFGVAGGAAYLLLFVVAVYFAITRVVRGFAVLLDGVFDSHLGPAPDSSARDRRRATEVPFPSEPRFPDTGEDDRPDGGADPRDGGNGAGDDQSGSEPSPRNDPDEGDPSGDR
jgi:hypothetical protein